ncbi:hypothetical protein [Thalassotalea mangrovi]|uniref:Peptidase M15A C-terminal domain-containing protein n=1 Tax=Thalassotalea mangrovi TaxID=2572245 RepID=A0A4V5NUG5_9GAMM|nr:hypothetical protein [Thalassotalea mangrovi]TKB46329.1 hypothetical protein E8M12_04555 [Thalassotalea mangrovi]
MPNSLTFSSKETKLLLGITDCELMHMRTAGELQYIKKGNAFLYTLHDRKLLLNHPIAAKVINWHVGKHDLSADNWPRKENTLNSLIDLVEQILIPLERTFGELHITYGFVSAELNRHIQKHSPQGTYPSIDQHSGSEVNTADNLICDRNGLACDFLIKGFEQCMDEIMGYIVNNLSFDKLYYYGADRPIHISVGQENAKHLQVMGISKNGRRIPGRKAFGEDAIALAAEVTE